eukprot:m.95080 g.95080  ORF g.95080 m.95080 type:complete len:87 (+) comp26785_c0_seq1:52-312(+)
MASGGMGGVANPLDEIELDNYFFALIQTKMRQVCLSKCVGNHYSQGDLEKGEVVCIDRCFHKYMQMKSKVEENFAEMQKQQAAGIQ